ncbi:MAG: hypothetical protein WCP60_04570 [bacterium]
MQKILIITASVLSLVAIGLGYVNRTHLVNEKAGRVLAEADRNEVNKKITTAYSDLKAAQEKLALATKDSEKLAPQLADLQSRLDKATSNQTDLQKQLSQKDTDMAQQKTDLAAKDTRIAELEAKSTTTTQAAPQQDDLKKQLEEKDLLTSRLQAKLEDSDKQIAELRKQEAQRRSKVMRTGLEGRILAVNPSWNFVVISLGDRNGVVNNAELLINRGGQLIGKVRVTSVEPSTSIADIVVNSIRSGLSVQPGDTVIYRGPETDADSNSKL